MLNEFKQEVMIMLKSYSVEEIKDIIDEVVEEMDMDEISTDLDDIVNYNYEETEDED